MIHCVYRDISEYWLNRNALYKVDDKYAIYPFGSLLVPCHYTRFININFNDLICRLRS